MIYIKFYVQSEICEECVYIFHGSMAQCKTGWKFGMSKSSMLLLMLSILQ